MIEVPEAPPRRTDRKHCEHCEASAAGCRSNAWLRGRKCCESCTGDHDQSVSRERPPERAAATRAPGTEGRERDPLSAVTDLRDTDFPTKENR